MHKNILWLIIAILCIYFTLIFGEEHSIMVQKLELKESNGLLRSDTTTAVEEEARTRRRHHHHLYSFWGFYGLAIAYLIKVKIVVVAFFVGSAIFLGMRYLWPHKCGGGGGIYKEGSIVLDHPPSFTHHDHVPYSFDHDHYHDHPYDSESFTGPASFEPYSAYSSQAPYAAPESSFPSSSFTETETSPESYSADAPNFRRKRSEPTAIQGNDDVMGTFENLARQMVVKEEQIGEFMLSFLGLDTQACRRRFICEMEFKAKTNALTAMAFRVIGRSIFAKYTNNRNPLRKANSFQECAAVNAECVFIENNEQAEQDETFDATQQPDNNNNTTESEGQVAVNDAENDMESNDSIEKENENNLKVELRRNYFRKRFRGDRRLKLS